MSENKSSELTPAMALGCALTILRIGITTPIWYWLIYQILVHVNATPLMWVFYWIYTPIGIFVATIGGILDYYIKGQK